MHSPVAWTQQYLVITWTSIISHSLASLPCEVSVLGYDPGRGERALKQRIGIVLQSTGVEPYLSVEETIDLFRGYFPHPLPLVKSWTQSG